MPFIDINGYEILILLVIAVIVLGPQNLPEYAAKLAQLVRRARGYADTARSQLREQMGPDFDDIDWKAYDPRQYDPRRIVREALLDDEGKDLFGRPSADVAVDAPSADDLPAPAASLASRKHRYDPTYTPFDLEAT